jgi:CRISPR-associated protein Csb2
VPVNDRYQPFDKDGKRLAQAIQGTMLGRDRKARKIPQAGLENPEAVVFWPGMTLGQDATDALSRLARQVSHIGHSSSLVLVDLITERNGIEPDWIPDPEGTLSLRVPYPGRFDELKAAYSRRKEMISWPPPGLSMNYIEAGREAQPVAGHHGELILFRLVRQGQAVPLEAGIRLLAVWRKALLAASPEPAPEVLSGHSPESTPEQPMPSTASHMALIPVPDVGHDFAAGHLLGLGAVLPRSIQPSERQLCLSVLNQVSHINLGPLGQVQLAQVDAFERRRALRPRTWTDPSTAWASVTPVVLGKYPKELFSEETCQIVAEACEIAGLPKPVAVRVGPVPWIVGSVPSARFPAFPSRPGKPKRAHVHVKLVFDRPVRGPVLVGAGRHLGYGLFRQVKEMD